jgi:hypothetical protein
MGDERQAGKLARLNASIQAICGLYSRVARKLGVDRSFVSRVAKGERRSEEVEAALVQEFERVQNQ